MLIEAFNTQKDIMEWLDDARINPEVTRDVLAKRIKRGTNPEAAITTPVIKGARKGDTKDREKARLEKMEKRLKMFRLAQKIRNQYEKGLSVEELIERHGVSQSQINKISGKQEWYNLHWRGFKIPEKYQQQIKNMEEKKEGKGE